VLDSQTGAVVVDNPYPSPPGTPAHSVFTLAGGTARDPLFGGAGHDQLRGGVPGCWRA
jgi:hypothetical protein